MNEHSADLVQTVINEGGTPRQDAAIEVQRAIQGVHIAREELAQLSGRQIPLGRTAASAHRLAWTTYEPIGPVVAVSGKPRRPPLVAACTADRCTQTQTWALARGAPKRSTTPST